jgi:hypothetical protein
MPKSERTGGLLPFNRSLDQLNFCALLAPTTRRHGKGPVPWMHEPRGMRGTDPVTRSIRGHATEAMQRRYSTVSGSEQADGLARVIRLFDAPS